MKKNKKNRNNKNAKQRNKQHHDKVSYLLTLPSSEITDRDGDVFVVTPEPLLLELDPSDLIVDRLDQEETLLRLAQNSPKRRADVELQKLIDEMKESSQTMYKLYTACHQASDDLTRFDLLNDLIVAKYRNFAAIHKTVQKLYDDCGEEGIFVEAARSYRVARLLVERHPKTAIKVTISKK